MKYGPKCGEMETFVHEKKLSAVPLLRGFGFRAIIWFWELRRRRTPLTDERKQSL